MDRIGPAGGTPLATLPNGQLGRQDENLGTGTEGTLDPSLYSNALQEEIMYLLSQAGVTPNINNWTQVYQSLLVIIGQASNGYIDTSGNFYFFVPLATGGNLIVQGGPCVLSVSTSTIQQLLPIGFQTAFEGGIISDGGASCYGYGITPGTDLYHATVDCALYQISSLGTVALRPTEATGFFICWGK